MQPPYTCEARKPHITFMGRPIWRVGISYFTSSVSRFGDHHTSIASAKAAIRDQERAA